MCGKYEYIFSNRSAENVALLGLEKFSQEKVRGYKCMRKSALPLKVEENDYATSSGS